MLSDEEAEEIREKLLEQLENFPEEQQEQAEALKKQIKNANKEQLEQFILQMQRGSTEGKGCVFCQIIEGKIETIKIYEDKDIIAILDIYPASLGHMIVMPKKHYETLEGVPDDLLGKLFIFIKAIMPSFLKITKAEGVNVFIAQGEIAGQTVSHFSINIIPRQDKDKIAFGWNRLKVKKDELEEIGEKLRKEAAREITSKIAIEKEKEARKRKKEEESEAEKIMKHVKRRMP